MAAGLLQRVEFYQSLMRESDYKAGTLKVAFALLFSFYNGKTGRCDPGQAAIAKAAGTSISHVKFAANQLKADGWFEVAGGQGAFTRHGRTTMYRQRIAERASAGTPSNMPGLFGDAGGELVQEGDAAAPDGVPALAPHDPLQGVPALPGVLALRGISASPDGVPALAPRTQERTKDRLPSTAAHPSTPPSSDSIANGAGALPLAAKVDDQFETFWQEYPRREGGNPQKPARQKFASAIKRGVDAATIILGAKNYAADVRRQGTAGTPFVAQAVTWLNQERWADHQTISQPNGPPKPGWL